MKRLLMIMGMLLFLVGNCWAGSVVLEWDANPEAQLAGYCLYRAERIGDHTLAWEKIATLAKDVTTFTDTIDDKNYAWQVTAFDTGNSESFVSNMVELYDRTPPPPTQNLRKQ